MQRRVEQPDRDGSPAIASKMPSKSDCCIGRSRSSAERRPSSSAAMIISRTTGSRSSAMNMCSVRRSPIPPRRSRVRASILRRVAFARTKAPDRVRPAEDRLEVLVDLRPTDEVDRAEDHLAGAAVDRDRVASGEVAPVQRAAALDIELEPVAAGDAGLSHPAGDDRRVRGHAAVGFGIPCAPMIPWMSSGVVSQPRQPRRRRARQRCPRRTRSSPTPLPGTRSAARGHLVLGGRVDHRVQELVELAGVDPRDGLLPRDQASSTMVTAALSAAPRPHFAVRVWRR